MKMKRTNFYYPQPMLDALKKQSDDTGVAVSEIIRQAVSSHIWNGTPIKQKCRRKPKLNWIEKSPDIGLYLEKNNGALVSASISVSNEKHCMGDAETGFIEDVVSIGGISEEQTTWLHMHFSIIDMAKEAKGCGDEDIRASFIKDLNTALKIMD